jgi:serine/threonine protein kinase
MLLIVCLILLFLSSGVGSAVTSVATGLVNPFEHIENLLSNPLTEEQKNVLTRKFSSHMVSISTKTMTILQARKLMKSIATALCTGTVAQMVKDGFVFDGMLGPTGQGKAVLYNVVRVSDFAVLCGKVYLKGDGPSEQSQFAEVMASEVLHKKDRHPNIVQYEHILDINHINHPTASLALIMPLYKLSLQAVYDAFSDHPVSWEQMRNVAASMISAGLRLEECKLVHCDIKPDNIMLGDGVVVLIDLGSVVSVGAPVAEYTDYYGMDCSRVTASHRFDIFCLVVTLCRGFVPEFVVKARTAAALERELNLVLSRYEELIQPVEICLKLLSCNNFTEAAAVSL